MASRSRHKSCVACIQTKRKCDRTKPSCQRCIARGTVCHYIGRNPPQQAPAPRIDSSQLVPASSSPSVNGYFVQHNEIEALTAFTPCTDASWFEFPNHPFNLASMPDDSAFIFDGINNIVPLQLMESQAINQDRPASSGSIVQARVEFVAKRLARVPRTFVEHGQTMFIHRTQFEDLCPPVLQDAMSACALYCMRTAVNQPFVFQNLQHKCQHLIANTDALHASRHSLLAATQALLIYQTIRLFDGDIRLRAHAEADEMTSVLWATRLQAFACDTAPPIPASEESMTVTMSFLDTTSDWLSWTLNESIRRTFIFAFVLKGIYNFLKLGHDSPIDLRAFHFFTAQAALWEAQSEVGWCHSRLNRERLEIQISQWDEDIKAAKPEDVDELSVLIMVMLWGKGVTRLWLGQEHSMLYGLDAPIY
ncbi:hypothetical protein T440DRAFT_472216 [Plenodomus tracheiphilus IPT5]|uniref:Zn(2)-C6 fungal-type domain-containing protein n=1 Tax=Plenodomus tracheiphilus IPT5 TaxID=1408161 RepID=A0A6A7AV99_9PLEO|nr:hypothetical protein T440DRAFT_472216 [Plenodomus tracheiphilus IPT5]